MERGGGGKSHRSPGLPGQVLMRLGAEGSYPWHVLGGGAGSDACSLGRMPAVLWHGSADGLRSSSTC